MPVSQAACPAAFKSQAGCVTRTGFLHQELTADGRYDETRGGRTHAYQGRFWVDGDRVDDLDDLVFRAYGGFQGRRTAPRRARDEARLTPRQGFCPRPPASASPYLVRRV
ncbi:Atu4866 domain-containing protein [Streptomyces tunisiensis]|uniref:Atu4866 domain-containing protein n=1 Tax=Streptomyces tunisiensis TaxID=948699 RepID=UPI00398962A4